jgi:hypothetical protein
MRISDSRHIRDPEFTGKITRAMQLLQRRAAGAYSTLNANVGRIRAHRHSGMDVRARPPTITIARTTFDASLTWLASVLAHESMHSVQYKARRPHTGVEAEQECNQHQLSVLRQIGAPQSEINHMLNQTGTHFDVDGDGDYDWDDYRARNW